MRDEVAFRNRLYRSSLFLIGECVHQCRYKAARFTEQYRCVPELFYGIARQLVDIAGGQIEDITIM